MKIEVAKVAPGDWTVGLAISGGALPRQPSGADLNGVSMNRSVPLE